MKLRRRIKALEVDFRITDEPVMFEMPDGSMRQLDPAGGYDLISCVLNEEYCPNLELLSQSVKSWGPEASLLDLARAIYNSPKDDSASLGAVQDGAVGDSILPEPVVKSGNP